MSPEDRAVLLRLAEDVATMSTKLGKVEEELTSTINLPEKVTGLEADSGEMLRLLRGLASENAHRDERIGRVENKQIIFSMS